MNHPILLPKERFVRSTWKNGIGYTDQIAIEPESADLRSGNYLWRISSASIEHASPFSVFPDHDRALVILAGKGIRLIHEDDGFVDEVELPRLEPYEFPGDIKSRCELMDGGVKDISIFFRKGMSASVEIIRVDENSVWNWEPSAAWNFLFAVSGSFEVCTSTDVTETLPEGSAFRVDGPEGEESFTFPVVPHGSNAVLIRMGIWR